VLKRKMLFLAVMLLFVPFVSWAGTYKASSCSYWDVSKAVEAASPGDTVSIPPGTCTWTEPLSISKSLILEGAGVDSTIIFRDSKHGAPLVKIVPSRDVPVRVTGIRFTQLNNNRADSIFVRVSGPRNGSFPLTKVRIDHCHFNKGGRQIFVVGWVYGVIDHNIFVNGNISVGVSGDNNYSWHRPIKAGTENSVFVETNTFIIDNNADAEPNHLIYLQEGARVVVRYNKFNASNYTLPRKLCYFFDSHGNINYYKGDSGDFRGQPITEIYNNIFHAFRATEMIGAFRGGSVLIHDNIFLYEAPPAPAAIKLTEEEGWQRKLFELQATEWPAEDQINNSFFWNNTLNGIPVTSVHLPFPTDSIFIQKNRDYWMAPPGPSSGRTTYVGRAGGAMRFSPSGHNAYYPYTPYTYPHPLTVGTVRQRR
jgi:hypothetical protein